MKVVVDTWAWVSKEDLTIVQLQALRATLTVVPRKVGDYPGDEDPKPIKLFVETDTHIGVAREYFLSRRTPEHEVVFQTTEGSKEAWNGPFVFSGALREEQAQAIAEVSALLRDGTCGGIIRAAPGWGKTVAACALMHALQVPTLVVVHKEFLVDQWRQRIEAFLPSSSVGLVQQDVCDFQDKSVVIGMVHSLVDRTYPDAFYQWPGLVITDEVHRIGAETWSRVPPKFPARWRVGFSATPRRKDGAEAVFLNHIGAVIFKAKEQRLKVKVRRVFTKFRLVKTENFNPALISKSLLLKFLCTSNARNQEIVDQLVLAVQAGRKIIVLSERLQHLDVLNQMLLSSWPSNAGPAPSTGFYVGGMSQESLRDASGTRVIFATSQFAAEGLDIPALDTLFLTTPLSDVEQAVGRIQRPYDGKKDPVVVDFVDDKVPLCKKLADSRDKLYARVAA